MLIVEMLSYDDLSEFEQDDFLSDNGCGKEYASYLKVIHDDKVIAFESDAMCPEDAIFCRDLKWIKSLLLRCYELGKQDSMK